MTDTNSVALQVALDYHSAWTSHDLDKAMACIDPAIICDAPAGRLEGAESFRAFMAPFVGILTGSQLLAAFGDDTTAVVVYNTSTGPVDEAPAAEFVTVSDGRIKYMRIIFDRLPFEAARRAAEA